MKCLNQLRHRLPLWLGQRTCDTGVLLTHISVCLASSQPLPSICVQFTSPKLWSKVCTGRRFPYLLSFNSSVMLSYAVNLERRGMGLLSECCVVSVHSSWNVMAHGDAREGKWRGNWWMEWVASTLHTTSEHGVSSITTADAHTSAASSRLNWRSRRFKWTRPFRRKTKSGFCACAITFQTQSTCRTMLRHTVQFKLPNLLPQDTLSVLNTLSSFHLRLLLKCYSLLYISAPNFPSFHNVSDHSPPVIHSH